MDGLFVCLFVCSCVHAYMFADASSPTADEDVQVEDVDETDGSGGK